MVAPAAPTGFRRAKRLAVAHHRTQASAGGRSIRAYPYRMRGLTTAYTRSTTRLMVSVNAM